MADAVACGIAGRNGVLDCVQQVPVEVSVGVYNLAIGDCHGWAASGEDGIMLGISNMQLPLVCCPICNVLRFSWCST